MVSVLLLLFLFCCANSSAKSIHNENSDDGRLNLTPYVEKWLFEEARKASEVDPILFAGVKSHAAYFNVNKSMGWNTFFWYFPVKNQDENTPWLIWLQGGPGASSLFGLFTEIGPIMLVNGTVQKMPVTWGSNYSLLFIDNPVGTGFSYSTGDKLATNEDEVGQMLLNFIQQFLEVFPILRKAPLFITGESYAGKYIPAFGHYIHSDRNDEKVINLRGLAIGDGWTDPPTLLHYSELGLQHGFIDFQTFDELKKHEDLARKFWEKGDMDKYITEYKYLRTTSRVWGAYNYLSDIIENVIERPHMFLNREDIQKAIHVGRMEYYTMDKDVHDALAGDMYHTVKPWLEELLDHYGVLCYNGQLDIVVSYALSRHTYASLKWSGSEKYLKATRNPISVNDMNYGYITEAGNFLDVMIRGAGHMVPTDQPVFAKYMIDMFINKFK